MTEIESGSRQELERLEESLWRPETRFDADYMERVLTVDFFEFGRSGRIYDRADTIASEPRPIDAVLPLRDFEVHAVTADIALVTYVSEVRADDIQVANRSSLWLRQGGRWRLRFHQGTPRFGA